MSEVYIKKYANKSKNNIDLYLNYLNGLDYSYIERIKEIEATIQNKKQELKELQKIPQSRTRTQIKNPSKDNIKIEKLETEISELKNNIHANKYKKIQQNIIEQCRKLLV